MRHRRRVAWKNKVVRLFGPDIGFTIFVFVLLGVADSELDGFLFFIGESNCDDSIQRQVKRNACLHVLGEPEFKVALIVMQLEFSIADLLVASHKRYCDTVIWGEMVFKVFSWSVAMPVSMAVAVAIAMVVIMTMRMIMLVSVIIACG